MAEDLLIKVGLDIDDLNRDATKAERKIRDIGDATEKAERKGSGAFGKLGGGMTAMLGPVGLVTAGVGILTGGLVSAFDAAKEEAVGIARLDQALKNNVAGFDAASAGIDAYISKQEGLAFADDQLRDSLAHLVGQTKDLGEAQMLQGVAMDLARAKGISLEMATKAVGKVDQDSIGILKKLGIQVEENMTKEQALAAIREVSAGQAEAYANTAAGSMDKLQNMFGNFVEDVGGVLLPLVTSALEGIVGLAEALGGMLAPAFEQVSGVINTVIGFVQSLFQPTNDVSKATSDMGTNFKAVWDAIQAFLLPVAMKIREELSKFWTEIQPQLKAAWENIQTVIKNVWNFLQPFIIAGVKAVTDFWREHWDEIQAVLKGVWDVIQGVVKTVWAVVEGVIKTGLSLISGDWEGAWGHIKTMFNDVWEGIKQIVQGAWTIVENVLKTGIDAVKIAWENAWNGISQFISDTWDKISKFVQGLPAAALDMMKSVGTNLIDGIKQGVKKSWDDFVSYLSTLIKDNLPGFIKDWLGIASPSDVVSSIAEEIPAGLAEGIDTGWGVVDQTLKKHLDPDSEEGMPQQFRKAFNDMFDFLSEAWGPQTDIELKGWFIKWTTYFQQYTQRWVQYWNDAFNSMAVPVAPGGSTPPGGIPGGGGGGNPPRVQSREQTIFLQVDGRTLSVAVAKDQRMSTGRRW